MQTGNWSAIVMAAGKGERMQSAVPKALHQLAGLPIVHYVLAATRHVAPDAISLVISPNNRDDIQDACGENVAYIEQPEPLGTGNALTVGLGADRIASRSVLVLNADVPLVRGETLQALADVHEQRGAAATVLTALLPSREAGDLGRFRRGARGKPIAIVEAGDVPAGERSSPETEVVAGAYAFDAEWLPHAVQQLKPHDNGEYYVTDLIGQAVADGRRVEALVLDDPDEAIGVNTRSQLARAEAAMQQRLRGRWMEQGVTFILPNSVYLDHAVTLGRDAVLHPNTSIRGVSAIGASSIIGPNTVLTNATVGERCTVSGAVVDSAVMEREAHVGPFSHIRAGTTLKEGAYVGSHAEIKNSTIGERSHVGHFSYIGDARVGEDVNIGAGAVTCNYDGAAKHETVIGAGAFIGSDSLLVAPVTIGEMAMTGAGAVVTSDVLPGQRVAGVPARVLQEPK